MDDADRLSEGGVPKSAEDRLRAQTTRKKPFFAANLSVNELGLVRKTEYHAVGQVMGSSIYHLGWQFTPSTWGSWGNSQELDTLTQAHLHARTLALDRIKWETRLLNAHGVVGVRFDRKMYDWGTHLIEFSLMGTAIRIEGAPPTDNPFVSDVSGEEFYQLWQAGFAPVGFAYGNCFWYQVASWGNTQASQGLFTRNQELSDFSRAVQNAQWKAKRRMEQSCLDAGGTGVVGVRIEEEVRPHEVSTGDHSHRTDLIVHVQMYGTAIRERYITHEPPQGKMAVNLKDEPLRPPVDDGPDRAIEGVTIIG
ncbi:MAG: heavy metal-binding domain-containing protein [Candidatus Xenobia bacterium]